MTTTKDKDFTRNWKNIVSSFLKLGVTYGGPGIWGIIQAELQEKQQWVSKERFVEGLSLVNMLPGAPAVQFSIFLGYARGGWWGGLLAGLCLVLPAFFIMLVLTMAYATLGVTPIARGALYGIGPVVLGIFLVAAYRLGKSTLCTIPQTMIAIVAAAALIWSSLGIAAILVLAGGVGLLLFHSKKVGAAALVLSMALLSILRFASSFTSATVTAMPQVTPLSPNVTDISVFFFKVGALTFGGGLTMIAFIHEQVVNQFRWLTPQEFIDGLALGQITPGPILMVAAYVGYKVAGIVGAVFAAAAVFLPAFMMMLAMLPVFDHVRTLVWAKAALQGIGPAVIGVIAVSLVQMAPHALPDPFAIAVLIATVIALLVWRFGALKLIIAGSVLGVLRSRLFSLPGVKVALNISLRARV